MDELIHLRIVQGPDKGKAFSIPQEGSMVGRSSSCDILLHDGKLSRHHCRFLYRGGKLTVTDLESSNGTLVNGTPVREMRLKSSDLIAIGDTVFEVVHDDLRPPLTFKRAEEEPAQAARPAPKPRGVPFLIRALAWLLLFAWFVVLAYSLIPRDSARRGASSPAGERSPADAARAAGTTHGSIPSPKAGAPSPGAGNEGPATPAELADRLRQLTKNVASCLVNDDYDGAQTLITNEAARPSSLPLRSRIESLATTVTAVTDANKSVEDQILKLTGKEMTIQYKGGIATVIPRAVVNGKLTFSLPNTPDGQHIFLAVTELAAADRLALLGPSNTSGKRILQCALQLKSRKLKDARALAPRCEPFAEAFAEIAGN